MTLLAALAWVRLALVPLALLQILTERGNFAPGYEAAAWAVLGAHALLAVALLLLRPRWRRRRRELAALNVAVDLALVFGLIVAYSWQPGQPLRSLLFLVVLEGAIFFRMRGGLFVAGLVVPLLLVAEWWRTREFDFELQTESIVLRGLVALALGGVVGRLVELEREQARVADARADEAERLRDELARRVDLFEAANRCARALGSSLELGEAFEAFFGELRTLVPFDRAAILLAEEGGGARVMATAGAAADSFLPPGTAIEIAGSILEPVVGEGLTVSREDILDPEYPEEAGLLELGLRSRVLTPLELGVRSIGALSLARREPRSFRASELELVALLGRLVATAVQNLRAYEAERTTVEELRRLSALRADFVSLVSHELRSPMAAVIGSARTLQQRWRELRPDQREAFLAVIADETTRLAALIGDVLDTSRLQAGTFGYRFADVDLAAVLRDAVSAAEIGQDEVRLATEIAPSLPSVRGDAERLRQLADNLISNALKHSPAGGEILVSVRAENGALRVRVTDSGPGIAAEHHGLIFEKFGRATGRDAKPGTGLGLFISRSFAEAHGGSLEVDSSPGRGATFTLTLPL